MRKFGYPNLNDIMVKIYTTNWCPSCISAKKLLESLNIQYKEINIEESDLSREQLVDLTGGYTVPQIIINSKYFSNSIERTCPYISKDNA